jgi:hypothetical protein
LQKERPQLGPSIKAFRREVQGRRAARFAALTGEFLGLRLRDLEVAIAAFIHALEGQPLAAPSGSICASRRRFAG